MTPKITDTVCCNCHPRYYRYAVFRLEDGMEWWLTQLFARKSAALDYAESFFPHSTPAVKRYCQFCHRKELGK